MRISYLRISFLTCWFQAITSRHAKFLAVRIERVGASPGSFLQFCWCFDGFKRPASDDQSWDCGLTATALKGRSVEPGA